MVQIDESILLTFAGMVFIPVFIFCIKMIIEVGNIKTKLDAIDAHTKEAKEMYQRTMNMETEIKVIKQDLVYRFDRQDESNERFDKSIDRLNQFSWGTTAKSYPPYMIGEEETREHKSLAGEGLFENHDSEETRTEKNERKEKR